MKLLDVYINPGLSLLPERMRSPDAVRMLVAIGMQESEFTARVQHGGGPARGFWQFEPIGVREVLRHPASASHVRDLAAQLVIDASLDTLYDVLAWNDALACGVARLALWRVPTALPGPHDADEGWRQYNDLVWRPGKPRPEKWPHNWRTANEIVAAYF